MTNLPLVYWHNKGKKNKKTGKILLATTGTMYISADSCTTGSQTKYDEYFKEVYRIVKSLPGKKLVVKPHPLPLLTKYVENLVNEIDPSITVIRNQDLHELISDCKIKANTLFDEIIFNVKSRFNPSSKYSEKYIIYDLREE